MLPIIGFSPFLWLFVPFVPLLVRCLYGIWIKSRGASGWSSVGDGPPLGDNGEPLGLDHCLVGKLIFDQPFNKVGLRVAIFLAFHKGS